MFFQLADPFRQFTHWQERCAFNFDGVILGCFATVQKQKLITSVQLGFDRRAINFERNFLGRHINTFIKLLLKSSSCQT